MTINEEISTKLLKPFNINNLSMLYVLDLGKTQIEWLCRYLGHTKRINHEHFRHMSGYIERTEVANKCLIQDMGLAGKFSGKKPAKSA